MIASITRPKPPRTFNDWRYAIAALAPGILACLSAACVPFFYFQSSTDIDFLSPSIAFFGGIVGGVISGLEIGRMPKNRATRIAMSLLGVIVMIFLSVTFGFCAAYFGGYRFKWVIGC